MKTERRGQPLRLTLHAVCTVSVEAQESNVDANSWVPFLEPEDIHNRRLAIVGGGPSIIERLDELDQYDDVWAVNYTASWLAKRGIESTMLSVDSEKFDLRVSDGVSRAILASSVDPGTALYFRKPKQFHLVEHDKEGIPGGTTTACRVPFLALRQGYKDVTFYGCESSFDIEDHVDRKDSGSWKEQIIVKADGREFRTTPQFMLQADDLSAFIAGFPDVFKERSGGLLGAMVNDPWWSVAAVSTAMRDHLIEINGSTPFMEPVCHY
jgi:hypothetical protein